MSARTILHAAALGLFAVPQVLSAQEEVKPVPATQAELDALNSAQASSKPHLENGAKEAAKEWDARIEQSKKADELVQGFAQEAAIPVANGASAEKKPEAVHAEAPKEGEVAPTRITCDGGMFFDTNQGVIVYLKNVVMVDPEFTLTAGDEVKIFLKKKPEEPKKDKKDPAPDQATDPNAKEAKDEKAPKDKKDDGPLGGAAQFGEMDHAIATGGVVVTRKDPKNGDVEARAASATYDATNQVILLKGGFPQFSQGKNYLRAKEADLWIRIPVKGVVTTQSGKWETGIFDLKSQTKKPN